MTDRFVLPAADERPELPFVGDERTQLDFWLDFHERTLLFKCGGLTPAQLKTRPLPSSSMSLLGLIRHTAQVHRYWLRQVLGAEPIPHLYDDPGVPDAEFDLVDAADAEVDVATLVEEVRVCRAAVAQWADLDAVAVGRRHGKEVSLRWIYLHLIEELARHNGQADLIRELVDGVTGE